jgi:hypothetical protein
MSIHENPSRLLSPLLSGVDLVGARPEDDPLVALLRVIEAQMVEPGDGRKLKEQPEMERYYSLSYFPK